MLIGYGEVELSVSGQRKSTQDKVRWHDRIPGMKAMDKEDLNKNMIYQ